MSDSPSPQAPAVQTTDLRRTFAGRRGAPSREALAGVSFRIEPGEVVGLLGPNGGGKSTLLRILTTRLRPTSGSASIGGWDVVRQPSQVRRRLGVVFQSPAVDPELGVAEHLRVFGRLFGLAGQALRSAVDNALQDAGLRDRAKERVSELSGGMRRRLELAQALLGDPAVLLLDEATVGLDAESRKALWASLRERAKSKHTAVLAATHSLDEAAGCDRLLLLSNGRLAGEGTPGELRSSVGGRVLRARALSADRDEAVEEAVRRAAASVGLADETRRAEDGHVVVAGLDHAAHEDAAATLSAEVARELSDGSAEVSLGPPTLEDVLLTLPSTRS